MLAPHPDEALVAAATGVEESTSSNKTLPRRSDSYTKEPQLTRTQASPPGSGSDMSRGGRSVGGSPDTRQSGTRLRRPQTLSGVRKVSVKSHILGFKCHFSFFLGSQSNYISFAGCVGLKTPKEKQVCLRCKSVCQERFSRQGRMHQTQRLGLETLACIKPKGTIQAGVAR